MRNILAILRDPSGSPDSKEREDSPGDIEMKVINQTKIRLRNERDRVDATLRAIEEPSKQAKEIVLLAINRLIKLGKQGKELRGALTFYLKYVQPNDDFPIKSMTETIKNLQQDLISIVEPMVEKNQALQRKVAEQSRCKFTYSLKSDLEQSYVEIVKLLQSPKLKLLLNENTNGEYPREVLQLASEFNRYLKLLSQVPQRTLNGLSQRRLAAKQQQQGSCRAEGSTHTSLELLTPAKLVR